MQIILLLLGTLNLWGILIMAYDKRRAKRGQWRVQEKTLFLIAVCGGSLGILAGMVLFHHKTKHAKFVFGVPLVIALQVLVWFYVTKQGFVIK